MLYYAFVNRRRETIAPHQGRQAGRQAASTPVATFLPPPPSARPDQTKPDDRELRGRRKYTYTAAQSCRRLLKPREFPTTLRLGKESKRERESTRTCGTEPRSKTNPSAIVSFLTERDDDDDDGRSEVRSPWHRYIALSNQMGTTPDRRI